VGTLSLYCIPAIRWRLFRQHGLNVSSGNMYTELIEGKSLILLMFQSYYHSGTLASPLTEEMKFLFRTLYPKAFYGDISWWLASSFLRSESTPSFCLAALPPSTGPRKAPEESSTIEMSVLVFHRMVSLLSTLVVALTLVGQSFLFLTKTGMVMRDQNMFWTLIIPGPDCPGRNIDIYLQPIVDELK